MEVALPLPFGMGSIMFSDSYRRRVFRSNVLVLLLLCTCSCLQLPVNSPYNPVYPDRILRPPEHVLHRPLGKYPVYFGDLHNHTVISDGSGTPEEAYLYARDVAHLDFIGLSDHEWTVDDSAWARVRRAADHLNEEGRFVTFRGFEWSSSQYGHVTVAATEEYCHSSEAPTNTFTGFAAWLETQEGVAIFNHPGRQNREYEFNLFRSAPIDIIVGMELWNKSNAFATYFYNDGYVAGDSGRGFYDEALSHGWKIGAAGGGDNHTATWGTYVNHRIGVLAEELTRESLLAAFHARRFYSTLDRSIVLSFTADSSEMGSTVTGCDHHIELKAVDYDRERFTGAVIFNGNHDTVKVWSLDACTLSVAFEYTALYEGDYLYAKVRQADGDEAITSPVWFKGCDEGP